MRLGVLLALVDPGAGESSLVDDRLVIYIRDDLGHLYEPKVAHVPANLSTTGHKFVTVTFGARVR